MYGWDHMLARVVALEHAVAALNVRLDAQGASAILLKLDQMEKNIMAAIDDLQADVAAEDTVIDSAVTLIQGFAAQLAAAGTDPTKLAALRSDIQTRTQSLAQAVAANTPAAPAP